jgi:hypothetical protein
MNRRSILNGLVFVCWQVGCSGCSESPTRGTSGIVDAASDGVQDTSADLQQPDGPGDGPSDPSVDETHVDEVSVADGGPWVASPYAQFSGCPIEHFADPSSVQPYPWLPCKGVPTGCRMLDTSSLPGAYGYTLTFGGRVGGGDPHIAVVRGVEGERLSPTLFRSDGSIAAAWAYPVSAQCSIQFAWVGEDEVALAVSPTEAATLSANVAWRVVVGPIDDILAGTAEQYDLKYDVYNLNAIGQLTVSDTMVIADGQPGGRLFIAQRPGSEFSEIPQPGALWSKHVLIGSELIAAGYEGRGNPSVSLAPN